MSRLDDIRRFYAILTDLEQQLGGLRPLRECHGRTSWPERGVYFFFEASEVRSDSGSEPRVVRVGTHALTETSKATLWKRLAQHRGSSRAAGGNHRGSIFRLLVGDALRRHRRLDIPTWGISGSVSTASCALECSREDVRSRERSLEAAVSDLICAMPLLWIPIDDPPGPKSLRGLIERNSIALLSNFERTPIDPPSPVWLGSSSARDKVCRSGLWNNRHVDEEHDRSFLDVLARAVESAARRV